MADDHSNGVDSIVGVQSFKGSYLRKCVWQGKTDYRKWKSRILMHN